MNSPYHGNNKIELEVVRNDGRPIVCNPIDVGELLHKQGHALKVGDGVHVRLEEYYSDDDESLFSSEEEEEENSEKGNTTDSSTNFIDTYGGNIPSPRYRTLKKYDDALHVMQGRGYADAKRSISRGAEDNKRGEQSYRRGGKSTDGVPRSLHDVWASFAPPSDPERSYKWLQSTSLMPSVTSRRFRLPPLMCHSAASYLDPTDQGQRVFLYGGITNVGKMVENEMYEFSLLTGNWWRVEGKQVLSPGNYGHTAVVVDNLHSLVVIGGIGPGGQLVQKECLSDKSRRVRYNLLFPCKGNAKTRKPSSVRNEVSPTEKLTLCSLEMRGEGESAMGFMPMLFDMHLRTHRWRAVKTAPELPVVFHTAVVSANHIYLFGGVTNQLLVSSQLVGVNAETYAISLIRPSSGAAPKARYLHSAVVYGNWMIVYGGFDAHNEPLCDVWAFDMVNERWEELECHGSPARGAHSACVVGSRLIIIGGFKAAINTEQVPVSSIFELQLVPTISGKYIWRELVVRPMVPPLAFSAACHCADDASFILYGGCTVAGKSGKKDRQDAKETTQRVSGGGKGNISVNNDGNGDVDNNHNVNGFWEKLVPFNDGFAFTFPVKNKKVTSTSSEDAAARVNELGLSVDPDELSPEFKAFVRRQQEFILKKNASLAQAMKKTTLEEQENMDTHLFLTSDEIELLLSKGDMLCKWFTEHKMETVPLNVPDREERVHLNEECNSLSHQLRDVLLSMKGHAPTLTAVKSKAHRTKSGRKLVDYSAAKPFRRVLVMSLVKGMKKHLKRLYVLNKALKTVEWSEKKEYIDAVQGMHECVNEFVQTVKSILEKYIEKRVELLTSAVERRKEHLLQLAEIVEKDRRERIFQKGGKGLQQERLKQLSTKGVTQSTIRNDPSRSASRRHLRYRSRSTGAGYYKDETQAVILLQPKQLLELLKKAHNVQKAATAFGNYYRSTVSLVEKQAEEVVRPQLTAVPIDTVANSPSLAVPVSFATSQTMPPSGSVPTADVVAGVNAAPSSEPVRRQTENIWRLASEQAERIGESVSAFARELESPSVVEGTAGTKNTAGEDEIHQTPLRLSQVRPLLLCKAKLEELQEQIPSILTNPLVTNISVGHSQDAETRRRFTKLLKGLSALVQYFTVSFLSKAGARPPRSVYRRVIHPVGVLRVSSTSISPPSHSVSASLLTRKKRHTLKVIETSNYSDPVVMSEEGNDASTQLQQQQQQPSLITFAPLSPSLVLGDASVLSPSDAIPLTLKPTSLFGDEAKTLVPPSSSQVPRNNEDVIVPSLKDTRVIPNAQPLSISWVDNNYGTAPAPTVGLSSAVGHEKSPPPHIILSHGPQTSTVATTTRLPSFRELSTPMHKGAGMEPDKDVAAAMVSFSPGTFHTHNIYNAAEGVETSIIPHSSTEHLEEDYFLFGRRYALEPGVAAKITADRMKRQVVAAEPRVVTSAYAVTISPAVGTPGRGPGASVPRKETPRLFSSHRRRRSVSNVPLVVATKPVRSGIFREKLTPGEAQILRARERLCIPLSQ